MKILSIIGIVLLCACNKDVTQPIPTQPTITFSIDSALTANGKQSLSKDNNGFYHLILSTTSNQTLSRITGKLLVDGKPNKTPSAVDYDIEWTSSHFWVIKAGETIGKVVKTYFNPYTGQLQTSQLPNLISQSDVVVPIVNSSSYSDVTTGEVNTMFAPVYQMKGDTITVVGKVVYSIEIPKDKLFSTIKMDSIQKSIRIICD
jgi:hypothetical protein